MKSSVICLFVFSLCSPASAATLKEAHALLKGGKYDQAKAAFLKLKRDPRARLGFARALLETGDYVGAKKMATSAAKGAVKAKALTLVGEALRLQGKTKAAIAALASVKKRYPKYYRARAYLGLLYHETGQQAPAKAIFDSFYDDYGADKIDKNSAELLTYVAIACRYTDNFRDASDVFGDAIKADPKYVEASIQWAEISLEKYEAGYAEKHYKRALKANPHHAGALVGLARVKLVQANDVTGALKLIKKALKTNPKSIDAEVVKAQILIDNEENNAAEAGLKIVLRRNPRHLGALTMLATSYYLKDDHGAFKKTKAKVFKINPRFTPFYHTVVRLAVRHHRYAESIKLSEEAIKIDPDDYYSLADMGTNYLRIGQDKKGLEYLKKAWNGDKFNVRNYNLLNLFDDIVAKKYVFIKTKHFRLRVHKDDQKLLRRIVTPLLERAYAHYVKKYKFRPSHPITVEFFRNPSHYAVRTVGLPGLSALGVCFGPVITTTSPTGGRFNWAQVLWHELNHVFTIQLSRSRVPRWLTEGLADMEPALINKEWKRENDFDIYKALRSGRLHGLDSMNSAFTRARNIQEMVVAYYQGSLMAIYLVKHYGLPKVIEALRRYGKGQRTETILPALTGLSLKALDARFRAAELKRLAHYKRGWFVDYAAYRDLDAAREKAKKHPNDANRLAEYAISLLIHGKRKDAKARAKQALSKQGNNKLATFVSAQLARGKERTGLLASLVTIGGDGYQVRLALGRAAVKKGDLPSAKRHMAAAKRFDPERGTPYHLLAVAYEKKGKIDAAIKELKGLATLQQQSFRPIVKLLALLDKKKDYAGIRRYGQMGYNIHPGLIALHRKLAEAYAEPAPRRELKRAPWHLETAMMLKPQKKSLIAELHAQFAKVYLLKKDKRRARKHYQKAKKANPDLAELDKIKSRL